MLNNILSVMIKKIKAILNYIIFSPFIITYLCKLGGDKVKSDLNFAYKVCRFYRSDCRFKMYMNLIIHLPEWRQLYLHRIGRIGTLLKIFYEPNLLLFIECPTIGGGVFIQHGYATHINAEAVGERVQIWQKVTIGVKTSGGGRPTIGNDVKIYTGACVLGDIKIGNNSIIGANAVVLKDVPDNCMALGVPAKIVPITDK